MPQPPSLLPIQLDPIAALIAICVMAPIAYYLLRSPGKKGGGTADLYALVVDEASGTIRQEKFVKIEDRVYTAIDTPQPLFLIVPPNTRIYRCRTGKLGSADCVLAKASSFLALPLDPAITSAVSHLLSTDEFAELSNEEVVKLLRKLYEAEGKKLGHMRISAPTTIAMAFDVKRVLTELLNRVFGAASEAVTHFFRVSRHAEKLESYLQALGTYAEKRHAWLWYIVLLVFVAFVGFAVVQAVMRGAIP